MFFLEHPYSYAGSKIVFTNGSQDPWRHASKQKSSPDSEFSQTSQGNLIMELYDWLRCYRNSYKLIYLMIVICSVFFIKMSFHYYHDMSYMINLLVGFPFLAFFVSCYAIKNWSGICFLLVSIDLIPNQRGQREIVSSIPI